MSEQGEVELPPLELTEADDAACIDVGGGMRIHHSRLAFGDRIVIRERQLREALAKIAALTAQVERLKQEVEGQKGTTWVSSNWMRRAKKAEAELATEQRLTASMIKENLALLAELAALREGERVTYRVDYSSNRLNDSRVSYTEKHARWLYRQSHAGITPIRLVEVITRERIIVGGQIPTIVPSHDSAGR